MRSKRCGAELALAIIGLGLLALAVWGPAVRQAPGYHHFADQRVLWHLPFALDVLSNIAFAVTGLAGLWAVRAAHPRALTNMQRAMATLFFLGLLLTAAGSAWYHAHPDDSGLAVDRAVMAVAFAGLLAFAVAVHVTERAAAAAGPLLLLFGSLAVDAWTATGNLLPWAVLQGGGVAVLAWLALLRPRLGAPRVRWSLVLLAYIAAKFLELADHQVYAITAGTVGGHTLKHLAAAGAAWPVISALAVLRGRRRGENGPANEPPRLTSRPLGDA